MKKIICCSGGKTHVQFARAPTHRHTHLRTQEYSHYPLNEPPNGAREWRELTAVETKTRLVHRQRDMWDLTQRSQISACGRDVNQFMRIFGKKDSSASHFTARTQCSWEFLPLRWNTLLLCYVTFLLKPCQNFWMSSLSAAFCKDFWFRLMCLVKLFLRILEI